MIQIGKINTLTVKSIQYSIVHLDGGQSGDILLHTKDAPPQCKPGDRLEVFIYVNREKQLRATSKTPSATVGEFAKLRVVSTTESGAYLEWGLDNDLLVPKSEHLQTMSKGRAYFVYVFLSEKTNRITASSKLDQFFSSQPPNYTIGQEVDLVIYDQSDLGYKAVVNGSHEGMLYKNEVFQHLPIGRELKGFIKKIRADFKIDLSLRGPQKTGNINQIILKAIRDHGGSMDVTDKSPPEEIYARFGVSKKVFKRAVGALYKKRLIVIDEDGITLADTSP